MELDYLAILALVIGNGAVLTIITLIFNHYQHKSEKDFEARKEAKEYYMKLYGYIAILDELIGAYQRSIETGKAKVFTKDFKYTELSSEEILGNFKNAYEAFSSFYIEKKNAGFEIFVSEKLRKLLIEFWGNVKTCCEDEEQMKDKKEVDVVQKAAEKTANCMEKLFGLK